MVDGETCSSWWDQASSRQAVLHQASGLERGGQKNKKVGNCQMSLRQAKNLGFPGGASGKESACQCTKHKTRGFDSWIQKNPWRRAW